MALPTQCIPEPPMVIDRLIDMKEVSRRTGMSRSTVYRHMTKGEFPSSRQLSLNNVRWLEREVQEWIERMPVCYPAGATASAT